MAEEWRAVLGYEGLYEVSNFGRVRSSPHEVPTKIGTRISPGRVMKLQPFKLGYMGVCLSKDNKQALKTVHRLVAEAFIENPDNLPQVNHKDENKANNSVDNLEWVTATENNNYGTRNQRVSQANKISKCKKVAQIKDGIRIAIFPSTISASHIADPGHIGACASGRRKTAGGYAWEYV